MMYVWYYADYATDYGYIYKFDLSDGSNVWGANRAISLAWPLYSLALDASSNAYASGGGAGDGNVRKYAAADGAATTLTLMGRRAFNPISDSASAYGIVVDDTLGLVIGSGYQQVVTSAGQAAIDAMYNLCVRTFDDSAGDQVCLGNTYAVGAITYTPILGSGMVDTNGSHIFALTIDSGGGTTVHKYSWDGAALNFVDSAAGPTYGRGLYIDAWGNVVVINVDFVTAITDRFYFYDTGLASLGSVLPFSDTILRTWDSPAGGSWIGGYGIPNGSIASTPAVPGVDPNSVAMAHMPAGANVCVYADGNSIGTFTTVADANGTIVLNLGATYDIVIAGFNYWSKFETLPLIGSATRLADKKIDRIHVDLHRSTYLEYAMGANATAVVADFNDVTTSWVNLKDLTFPFGSMKKPTVYMQTFEPLPLCVRGIIPEVSYYRSR
jgi:hypothetical protein